MTERDERRMIRALGDELDAADADALAARLREDPALREIETQTRAAWDALAAWSVTPPASSVAAQVVARAAAPRRVRLGWGSGIAAALIGFAAGTGTWLGEWHGADVQPTGSNPALQREVQHALGLSDLGDELATGLPDWLLAARQRSGSGRAGVGQ